MTTDTSTVQTSQLNAAGGLLAILSAHRDLPAPVPALHQFLQPAGDIPWGAWGVKLSLHRLDAFEQWREALDLDPSTVDSGGCGTTRWLTVDGTSHGVPVQVNGFYTWSDR
ncbi:hypothetical protein [Kitasatospora purpeofusca]|uniref:hypothetical protein n=1 Tax=Kitasatospora purpeofusca TaxID=67352 RepID=UPI00386B06B8|nr:hypothetical protein OIP63_20765 [Kitasatospora purpeofusca]